MAEFEQLSFDVGGEHDENGQPQQIVGTFRVAGVLRGSAELLKGEPALVTVANQDGAVVAVMDGFCAEVAFREHRPKDGPRFTERKHRIIPAE